MHFIPYSIVVFSVCLNFITAASIFHIFENFFAGQFFQKRIDTKFSVYWNAPTFQCNSHDIFFDNLSDYQIIQNLNDSFRGDRVTILYDPGFFPALLKNETGQEYFFRNGGVPQNGDLLRHLNVFESQLNQLIINPNYNGLAIIDFESWRPIFRQNFGELVPYRDVSIEMERRKHPYWPNDVILRLATSAFEKSARLFMEETLLLAKKLRPNGQWGYYAYPYCFNMNGNGNRMENCPSPVPKENDKIEWLFRLSDVYYPSIYLSKKLSSKERQQLISGRIVESQRLASKQRPVPKIIPYFWYKYRDEDSFLSQEDIEMTIQLLRAANLNGVIIWGSSNDVKSKLRCQQMQDYVVNILGPTINATLDNQTLPN